MPNRPKNHLNNFVIEGRLILVDVLPKEIMHLLLLLGWKWDVARMNTDF